MNKLDLNSITTDYFQDSVKYLKFFIELNEGLLFDPSHSKDESDSKSLKRKRINPNWFYLYEKNY